MGKWHGVVAVLIIALLLPAGWAGPGETAEPAALQPLILDPFDPDDLNHRTRLGGDDGIGPGSLLRIDRGTGTWAGCTSNFVWSDDTGKRYLGTAGHCLLIDAVPTTHGLPSEEFAHIKVEVAVEDCLVSAGTDHSTLECAERPVRWVPLGPVVYADQDRIGHDFGIIEIPDDLSHLIRDALPTWGHGFGVAPAETDETILHYGYGLGYHYSAATRARVGQGDAVRLPDGGVAFYGTANMGDSGSGAVTGTWNGTTNSWEAAAAYAILTHVSVYGGGIVYGTHIQQAQADVWCATGLDLTLPGVPPTVVDQCEEPTVAPSGTRVYLSVPAGLSRFTMVPERTFTPSSVYWGAASSPLGLLVRPVDDASEGTCGGQPAGWSTFAAINGNGSTAPFTDRTVYQETSRHRSRVQQEILVAASTPGLIELVFDGDVPGPIIREGHHATHDLFPTASTDEKGSGLHAHYSFGVPFTALNDTLFLGGAYLAPGISAGRVEWQSTVKVEQEVCQDSKRQAIAAGPVPRWGASDYTVSFVPSGSSGMYTVDAQWDYAAWEGATAERAAVILIPLD